jgi:hypothetical protein
MAHFMHDPQEPVIAEWERECIERETRVQQAMDEVTARPGALARSGWYRLTPAGWQQVPDAEAEDEVARTGGWDLVHFRVDGEEVTLW